MADLYFIMGSLNMVTVRENRIAVLALTSGGARLASSLEQLITDVQLLLPNRLISKDYSPNTVFFDNWQQAVRDAFNNYRYLIFIMATGIVVRTLAPLVESKKTDPAVLVMDEKGQFVISLLSGHLGGANGLANKVANLVGGTAVITTATDVRGVPALEMLAQELDCAIYPGSKVKTFNRLLVEGERVLLHSQWPLGTQFTAGFNYVTGEVTDTKEEPVVYITNKIINYRSSQRLMLRPCNLVAGVGCRKGVSREQVVSAVKAGLKMGGFSILSLKAIATVDLKMQEPGLIEAAKFFKIPLVEVTREQIASLAGQFTPSDFVKEKIGVGGVCEPAAMTASGMGQIRVPKQKLGPVTVAIAEARLWWWD